MIKELIVIVLGFLALYLTPQFGVYSVIAMMVLIEMFTTSKVKTLSNVSFLLGMFLSEAYFLYTNNGLIELQYFIYVGFYLLVRHKGNEWFFDNKVNEYLYLLFAISMPIFLDFITQLAEIQMNILLFVTLYLVFLRMSDWILKTKLAVFAFAIIQIVSAYSLENFILQNEMKLYFVAGIVMWVIMKLKTGGEVNVSKVFDGYVFRKGSKGLH